MSSYNRRKKPSMLTKFPPSPSFTLCSDGWISFVSVWVTHLGEGGVSRAEFGGRERSEAAQLRAGISLLLNRQFTEMILESQIQPQNNFMHLHNFDRAETEIRSSCNSHFSRNVGRPRTKMTASLARTPSAIPLAKLPPLLRIILQRG